MKTAIQLLSIVESRSVSQGRFIFLRICREIKNLFPDASKIDFNVVPDTTKAQDGVRNFYARCVRENGSTRLDVKESVICNMPTDEYVDLMKHELAHAFVRARKLGQGHDQAWNNCFRKFGGSGQLSPYCKEGS